jgi:hypothetical protein
MRYVIIYMQGTIAADFHSCHKLAKAHIYSRYLYYYINHIYCSIYSIIGTASCLVLFSLLCVFVFYYGMHFPLWPSAACVIGPVATEPAH